MVTKVPLTTIDVVHARYISPDHRVMSVITVDGKLQVFDKQDDRVEFAACQEHLTSIEPFAWSGAQPGEPKETLVELDLTCPPMVEVTPAPAEPEASTEPVVAEPDPPAPPISEPEAVVEAQPVPPAEDTPAQPLPEDVTPEVLPAAEPPVVPSEPELKAEEVLTPPPSDPALAPAEAPQEPSLAPPVQEEPKV